MAQQGLRNRNQAGDFPILDTRLRRPIEFLQPLLECPFHGLDIIKAVVAASPSKEVAMEHVEEVTTKSFYVCKN